MAFLEVRDVNKNYGAKSILKNVHLNVEEGGFLVLVGPSGSGKSTLLHAIAGLERVDAGQILINGRNVEKVMPADRDIAMVFQNYALYPNMTAGQNIAFGLEMHRIPKPERDAAVQRVAKTFKIDHLLQKKPQHLSGGQRQRVSMARALVRDPQIFLFDEPLTNLDAKLKVDIRGEIKRLHKQLARTMVYVTHDQVEAMSLATTIAVIKDGVVQQVGTPDEVYHDPNNLFVADFMGVPGMNLIKTRVAGEQSALNLLIERSGLEALQVPVPVQLAERFREYLGGEIVLGVRPEALTDVASARSSSDDFVTIDCLIELLEPIGSDTFAITRLGGRHIYCRLPANTKCRVGEIVPMALQFDRTVYFDPDSQARIA